MKKPLSIVGNLSGGVCSWAANILACNPVRRVTLTTEPGWNRQRGGSDGFTGSGLYWLEGEDEPHLFTGAELNAAMRPNEPTVDVLLRSRWPGIEFRVPVNVDLTRMDTNDMMTSRRT